jgi:hypothetical protein
MPTVTVRGRAEADVEPDQVRLVFVVQAEAAAGTEALAMVAERSAAADEALDGAGELLLLRRPAAVTLCGRASRAGRRSSRGSPGEWVRSRPRCWSCGRSR